MAEIKSLLIMKEQKDREVTVAPLPGLSLTDISLLIPKELAKINDQVLRLQEEIDLMKKFDTDFQQNIFKGIGEEDKSKLEAG